MEKFFIVVLVLWLILVQMQFSAIKGDIIINRMCVKNHGGLFEQVSGILDKIVNFILEEE